MLFRNNRLTFGFHVALSPKISFFFFFNSYLVTLYPENVNAQCNIDHSSTSTFT